MLHGYVALSSDKDDDKLRCTSSSARDFAIEICVVWYLDKKEKALVIVVITQKCLIEFLLCRSKLALNTEGDAHRDMTQN